MIFDLWWTNYQALTTVGEKIKNFLLVRVRLFYLQDSTDIIVAMDRDASQDILADRTVEGSKRENCRNTDW